jgi:hypothetical protein
VRGLPEETMAPLAIQDGDRHEDAQDQRHRQADDGDRRTDHELLDLHARSGSGLR